MASRPLRVLEPVISLSVWKYMNFIMTPPTKSDTVRHLKSKLRGLLPRLNMMHHKKAWFQFFATFLTRRLISIDAGTTPLPVRIRRRCNVYSDSVKVVVESCFTVLVHPSLHKLILNESPL